MSGCHRVPSVLLYSKFNQNRMIFCGDMAIYPFAIRRPSSMLNFRNLQFLSCDLYRCAILLSCAKFHWNQKSYGQKRCEIYAVAHLYLSTTSFKCLSWHICFMLIINKHFNFCCFKALAYATLDTGRLCAVFLYNICCFNSLLVGD